jgi:predicted O-methyltransferase YrrM
MPREEIIKKALSFKYGGMSEGELSFLYDFCKDKDVLELGSMVGMSSYAIASVAKSLHCVDVWDDNQNQKHLEHDKRQQKIYLSYSQDLPSTLKGFKENCKKFLDSGKIIMHRGTTEDRVSDFGGMDFNIVFIDADHLYFGISNDYKLYNHLVRKDGYIIFHDYEDPMWTDTKNSAIKWLVRIR